MQSVSMSLNDLWSNLKSIITASFPSVFRVSWDSRLTPFQLDDSVTQVLESSKPAFQQYKPKFLVIKIPLNKIQYINPPKGNKYDDLWVIRIRMDDSSDGPVYQTLEFTDKSEAFACYNSMMHQLPIRIERSITEMVLDAGGSISPLMEVR